MNPKNPSYHQDSALIQRILDQNHWGKIDSLRYPTRGSINPAVIVNERYVIRFDVLYDALNEPPRFQGEARAYAYLAPTSVPVPRCLCLDLSRTLCPLPFMVTSMLAGEALIDLWPKLSTNQQQHLSQQAGAYLAQIHQQKIDDGFYKLCEKELHSFQTWPAYVENYFKTYLPILKNQLNPSDLQTATLCLQKAQPLLAETVPLARLIHGDYHFENLLAQPEKLTAIIDFEHAKAADPAWDFRLRDQWESECSGSLAGILNAYGPLSDHFETRIRLYEWLKSIDDMDWFHFQGDQNRFKQAYQAYFQRLNALKEAL
ncbi:hypothetical protein MASR2M15_14580 [Anaerolineales bacterium]